MRPRIALMFRGVLRTNNLIHDARQCNCSRLAQQSGCESRERRFLRIDFDKFTPKAFGAGPQRPIDDISKSRRGSGYDHKIANSTTEITFNSLHIVPRQLLAKPNDAGSHEGIALRASWNDIFALVLVLVIVLGETKITTRAPRNENVAMNLHHLLPRESGTRVQVVHVLSHEQELVCVFGQSRDCRVRCVRLRVADPVPPFAIPFPNKFRISRECFRCCQSCRIEVSPVAVLSTKGRNSAFSRNAGAGENENTHNIRSIGGGDFQVSRYTLLASFRYLMLPIAVLACQTRSHESHLKRN
jgi:hypothetical protein